MQSAELVSPIPGVDTRAHNATVQQAVAADLSKVFGAPVAPGSTIPAHEQNPLPEELHKIASDVDSETDWDDTMRGLKGRGRTEPSKKFLGVMLGWVKKRHPEADIKLEG